MLKKPGSLLLLFLLTACSYDENNNAAAAGKHITEADISYRMIDIEEGEDDPSLPSGSWQALISYPEIQGKINEPVKHMINQKITRLARTTVRNK